MPETHNFSHGVKVLVALDGSPDWADTTAYLARIVGARSPAAVLLYHVLELNPESASRPGDEEAETNVPVDVPDTDAQPWLAERKSEIETKVLRPAREVLEASESGGRMAVRSEVAVVSDSGVAEMLMRKVRQAGFDTIVVGRRQRGKAHGPGWGHVAERIVREMSDCPVWILD